MNSAQRGRSHSLVPNLVLDKEPMSTNYLKKMLAAVHMLIGVVLEVRFKEGP